MRIQFDVAAQEMGWIVRRNGKVLGAFASRVTAVGAAENFARASARYGDTAVVRVVAGGEIQEERNFASDIF
jgi:sugar/nucleoside kinase (ribokinase family)